MQNKQHGSIGFIILTYAIERLTESKEEDIVIQRVNDFNFGWLETGQTQLFRLFESLVSEFLR